MTILVLDADFFCPLIRERNMTASKQITVKNIEYSYTIINGRSQIKLRNVQLYN